MRKLLFCLGITTLVLGTLAVPAAASSPSAVESPGTLATVTIPERWVPVANRYIPPHVGGDREFDGHGPDVYASATLFGIGTSSLWVQLAMEATETLSDWTRSSGTSTYLIYQAQPGHCIRGISEGTYDQIYYRDSDTADDIFSGQLFDSFVREYNFVGDTAGSEAGTRTGVAVATRPIHADVQLC